MLPKYGVQFEVWFTKNVLHPTKVQKIRVQSEMDRGEVVQNWMNP